MAPLAACPTAHADIDDLIFQPIVNVVEQTLGALDPSVFGSIDPGLDINDLLAPAVAAVDPLSSLDSLISGWFQAFVNAPAGELGQSWITGPLGQAMDPIINSTFAALTGHGSADGAAAGWLFGDGGSATAGGSGGIDSGAGAAAAGGSGADAPSAATVPLQVNAVTEPVVDISVGGGSSTPVLVDTGSNGLVIPWQDIGLHNIGFPTGIGVGAFSGGIDYLYLTVPTTVTFTTAAGTDITTAQTPVDVEFFAWPTTSGGPASISDFLGPAGADGILGVGPNAVGPGPSSPITALPGDLSDGVLINQPAHELVFGPDPLTGGISVSGAPDANLKVSIDGLPPQPISAIIDSGGVYGTLPSSTFGGTAGNLLPAGTEISVFTSGGQPLYSYTVGTDSLGDSTSPTDSSDSQANTGNIVFEQEPVYISNSPSGQGTTIFGGTS